MTARITLESDLQLLGVDMAELGRAVEAPSTMSDKTAAFRLVVAEAHKVTARRWHPDVCKEPDALERMQAINELSCRP